MSILIQVKEFVLKAMTEELVRQGHNVTGELIQSLLNDSVIVEREGSQILEGRFLHYGIQMDIGRRPGKFVPISALVDWILRKGISTGDRDVVSLAWAISFTIMREGIPTQGSRAQGKKTGWMSDTLDNLSGEIESELSTAIGVEIENDILTMIKQAA